MGGAALIVGAALLVAGPGSVSALEVGDEARRTVSHEYRLVACESVLPLTCGAGGSTAGLFNAPQGISVDVSAFTAALSPNGAFLGLIGPGGLLIGDGLDGHDAYVDENGVFHAATAGGNGGLLWGNGGNGGRGLDAGVYTVLDPETGELVEKFLHATDGADGGRGGLLWGNGGNGGNGGNVGAFGDPVRADAAGEDVDRLVAGNGGNGGRAGILWGFGGNGGNGGQSHTSYADAVAGNGGDGGWASWATLLSLPALFGVDIVGGNGGNGGLAIANHWHGVTPGEVPSPGDEDVESTSAYGGHGGRGYGPGSGGNGGQAVSNGMGNTVGGNGGDGGFMIIGKAGHGGNGGRAWSVSVYENGHYGNVGDATGGNGGNGGTALVGDAGNGGNGGEAEANAANRTARGGAGGNGGDVVGGGTAGNGGNGGKASSKPWDREPAYVPGNEIPKAEDGKAIGGKGGRGGKGVILGGGGNGGNGGDSEALGVGGKATAGAKGVGGRGGLFSKSGQDGTKGSKQDGPSGGID